METRRERIGRLLREAGRPLSVAEIAALLGVSDRAEIRLIYDDLAHVARSVRRRSGGREEVVMLPPVCRSCGYVFKDLRRPRLPGRCPRCRSERIEPPRFTIVVR